LLRHNLHFSHVVVIYQKKVAVVAAQTVVLLTADPCWLTHQLLPIAFLCIKRR